jgi:hypothetical protein
LEGIAILDTRAMPLLIGRAGMAQMGWTDGDAVPNAVRLGLADGKSTHLHGLTRKTVKFTFNPESPSTISIAVRAVVTDAPYNFLVGNIILWTIGATLDAWREELRYRVDWLKGPSLADDTEGQVSIVYTRDPGPPVLPAAQFCAPAWALTTGGGETEEDGSLPDLADGTESEGNSEESEEEAGPEETVEVTPVDISPADGLWPWEREWAPDATTNRETGCMVLSSLPSREYHGPAYVDEQGPRRIYALRRRFYADLIELHVFRNTEEVVLPPGYEVVARVERDAMGNWPRWAQETVERRAARRRAGAPPERVCEEDGLYKGPVLLYCAEQTCGFNFSGVGVRPGDQPVAPEGYYLLPEEPMVLWGKAAEREVALNRLRPLGPFVPDVSWDELPQAFMAMDTDHWRLLGTSRWVQRGEPRGSATTSWRRTKSGTGP